MSPTTRVLCVLLPALGACVATGGPATATLADVRLVAEPHAAASARPSSTAQGGDELAIWSDAAFRRDFARSYMAETEIEPRLNDDERETMQEILGLIAADRMDDALLRLESERGDAATAVFDFTVANIHFQKDRLPQAAAAYEVAVDKHPKFRRAWRNLALIHVRENAFEQAVAAFTRVVELGGGDAVTYGLLGYACANLDRHLAAESAYRMAVLLDPRTLDWQMGLARAFFKQGRFADAGALCAGLIAAHPDRGDLWMLQANAWIGQGLPAKAAENLEMVDRLGQSTADGLCTLGDVYTNQELFDLAVSAYLRALDKAPPANAQRVLRAAKVLTARGALRETRELIARLEAVHGAALAAADKKDLLHLRSRLAMAEGAGDEEASVLEEIVALDPLDGDALILLGQHAARRKDIERAVFWYERAASLPAFEADAKVRQAQALVGQGRYGEALPLLRRAQSLKPRDNIQEYLQQVERAAQNR
jgi:tetratricopeptide (TPR) repeat protein